MTFGHDTSGTQSAVIQLLLATHPTLLHRDEIRREIGADTAVDDALAYFARMGLVHALDEFYWATRGALAAEEAATAHVLLEDRRARPRG